MTHTWIARLIITCVFLGFGYSSCGLSQEGSKSIRVDWKKELQKAQDGIGKNPKSSFWHNQAGVAYDALGDVESAERELTLASNLDSTNPIGYYCLYAFYQRRGTLAQQRKALINALESDSANPLGHFQLGVVLEKEGYLTESLSEYRTAKSLVSGVKGPEYIDPRGNPNEIEVVRNDVEKYIDRVVAKLKASQQPKT
jgi:tetratricopeptide (TPR) repeat protein